MCWLFRKFDFSTPDDTLATCQLSHLHTRYVLFLQLSIHALHANNQLLCGACGKDVKEKRHKLHLICKKGLKGRGWSLSSGSVLSDVPAYVFFGVFFSKATRWGRVMKALILPRNWADLGLCWDLQEVSYLAYAWKIFLWWIVCSSYWIQ